MTIDAPAGVVVSNSAAANRDQSSYVDWPAIIAGIILASAISLVLISFGSAVGLNFLDFGYGDGPNPIFVGIAAATWFLWVQISSFMAGGYLTGRLRRRYFDATEDESDLRDGAHGLLVWAGAAILGTIIAVGGIGAAANAVGSAAATVTTAASNTAEGTIDPNAYFVDTLFRTTQPVDATVARNEAGRIFAQAALGDGVVAEEDRTYLANVVAANTGLTPEEAQARVDQVITNVEAARQQAIEAARIARNTAIIGAFLLAASLLVSAIGAFWAAQKGGNHRDENTVLTGVFTRF
uniref:Mll5186 protein n=1 Tax=alpha proteobacterium NT18-17 TaxID=1778876 RepID=A0A140D6Q6_9PROT|nr:Mll5186 protein [alpha proteobacterium NT18-17]